MSLTINTNTSAINAAFNLSKNNDMLNKSLNRLSSGKRITKPSDDAGGLAISMKLTSSIARTRAASSNIQNAQSFSSVQDGAMQAAAKIVDRMSELKSLSLDVMKSSQDVGNYNTEFKSLQQQLKSLTVEKFNGVSLFNNNTSSKFGDASTNEVVEVYTSDSGAAGSKVSMHKAMLLGAVTFNMLASASGTPASHSTAAGTTDGNNLTLANSGANAINIDDLGVSFFVTALENVATLRAVNGATSSRLSFSEDHLRLTQTNLTAANSRIMDVDVAEESTNLAKYSILSQASAAMLAQANTAPNTALMLLG
jgi:flagellin